MLELTTGHNSPLKNVADSLYLGDFSVSETEQLVAETLRGSEANRGNRFQTLHDWTGGHPYWTQLLGEALDRQEADLSERAVKDVVEQLLGTEDRNLPHIFRALEKDAALWELVGALLGGTPISFTRANRAIAQLELLGLVKNENGRCSIRNRIYREALERHPLRRPRVPGRNLRRLTQLLLASSNPETLLQVVATELQAGLQNRAVIALARRTGDRHFTAAASVGFSGDVELTIAADSQLAQALGGPTEPDQSSLTEREVRLIERLGVKIIVPVTLRGQALAFFWLGRKLFERRVRRSGSRVSRGRR